MIHTEQTYSSRAHTVAAYIMNFLNGCYDESVDEFYVRIGDVATSVFPEPGIAELVTDTLEATMLHDEIVTFLNAKNFTEYNLVQALVNENSEIVVRLIRF
jgi:hypothetical protein